LAFSTAGVGAILATLTLYFGMHYYVKYKPRNQITAGRVLHAAIVIFGSIVLSGFILTSVTVADVFFIIICIVSIGMVLYSCKGSKSMLLQGFAFLIYLTISVVFWAIFYQIFMSSTLLIERLVNTNVFGWHIPTARFLSFEALGAMVFGLAVGKLWFYLAEKGRAVHDGVKFSISLVIIAIAFGIVLLGLYLKTDTAELSALWIISSYMCIALGELCLSPIGLSIANKLAPQGYSALFVGIWYASSGLSGKLAAITADLAAIPKDMRNTVEIAHVYMSAYTHFII